MSLRAPYVSSHLSLRKWRRVRRHSENAIVIFYEQAGVVVVFYLLPEEVVAKLTRMRALLPAAEDDYQVGVEVVPGSA